LNGNYDPSLKTMPRDRQIFVTVVFRFPVSTIPIPLPHTRFSVRVRVLGRLAL
jgi:hypothetical protein